MDPANNRITDYQGISLNMQETRFRLCASDNFQLRYECATVALLLIMQCDC